MRDNYDFSNAVKNPYISEMKQQITIRLDVETIRYFKDLASSTGMPYQTLMNSYLTDCAKKKLSPQMVWQAE